MPQVDAVPAACYPESVVSRRLSSLPSTILACAAVVVYVLAIAAPRAFPASGAPAGGSLLDDGHHTVAPHAPRSDGHLTRQRDARTAGTVHLSLPVAVLPAAGTSITVDVGRSFRVESEQRWVQAHLVSARTSRGPPDRRA